MLGNFKKIKGERGEVKIKIGPRPKVQGEEKKTQI